MMSESKRSTKAGGHDVVCGRGNYVNTHPGNQLFRDLIKSVRVEYVASEKRKKKIFALEIVKTIQNLDPPGRFLVQSANGDEISFEEIEERKAIDKTRQALREGAPPIEKGIKEGKIIPREGKVNALITEAAVDIYTPTSCRAKEETKNQREYNIESTEVSMVCHDEDENESHEVLPKENKTYEYYNDANALVLAMNNEIQQKCPKLDRLLCTEIEFFPSQPFEFSKSRRSSLGSTISFVLCNDEDCAEVPPASLPPMENFKSSLASTNMASFVHSQTSAARRASILMKQSFVGSFSSAIDDSMHSVCHSFNEDNCPNLSYFQERRLSMFSSNSLSARLRDATSSSAFFGTRRDSGLQPGLLHHLLESAGVVDQAQDVKIQNNQSISPIDPTSAAHDYVIPPLPF